MKKTKKLTDWDVIMILKTFGFWYDREASGHVAKMKMILKAVNETGWEQEKDPDGDEDDDR